MFKQRCGKCERHIFKQCKDNPCTIRTLKPIITHYLSKPIKPNESIKLDHNDVQGLMSSRGPKILTNYLIHNNRVDQLQFEGVPLLVWACQYGRRGLTDLLLCHGADPRTRCNNGYTALYYAIKSGCLHTVDMLLAAGCNVNGLVKGQSYLYYAVDIGHPQIVKLLLHNNADPNRRYLDGKTALQDACRLGRLEIVKLLLAHNAELNCKTKRTLSPLAYAVISEKTDVIKALAERGADLQEEVGARCWLLHVAASVGSFGALCLLLSQGQFVDTRTMLEETPLHLAVEGKNEDVLGLLLQCGADINALNLRKQTPLHFAVEFNWPSAMYELLARGADPEPRDRRGSTPLALAVELSKQECIEPLLTYGVDVRQFVQEAVTCPALMLANMSSLRREFERYNVKRRVAGLEVSPSAWTDNNDDTRNAEHEEFALQCAAEVTKMKKSRLHGDLSYFGFLHSERRRLVNLASLSEVCDKFQYMARKFLHFQFPLYANMIERNYFLGVRYQPVYERAVDSMSAIVNFSLPLLPIEKVLSYLDAKDMENLVKAQSF